MKTTILMSMFILLNASCKNDDNTPENPVDLLPPATQIGAQTFGCLVNGKVFLPKNFGQGMLNAFYQNIDGQYFISISAESGEKQTESQFIVIGGISVPALEEKSYDLISDEPENFFGLFTNSGLNDNARSTTDAKPGKLIISNLDTQNFILSGTFEFTVLDNDGKEIKITDGRFDVKYTN